MSSPDDQLQASKDLLLSLMNQASQVQGLGEDMDDDDEELAATLKELEAAKTRLQTAKDEAKSNASRLEQLTDGQVVTTIANLTANLDKQLADVEQRLKQ
jgi:hypothetical protein